MLERVDAVAVLRRTMAGGRWPDVARILRESGIVLCDDDPAVQHSDAPDLRADEVRDGEQPAAALLVPDDSRDLAPQCARGA